MGYRLPANPEAQPDGGYTVTFDGFPGATEGATREEAPLQAGDLLETALSLLIEVGKRIPAPAPARDRPLVAPPPLTAAKLALHEAMLDACVTDQELANRLGVTENIVRRLRDPLHKSRIEDIEAALLKLRKRLEVTVREVA